MHRAELLVWGDKNKAAEEYALAKEGKELSYSMSARVPVDVCNCCGNRAKSRAEYCSHMRESAGQYLPEFRKYAFVDNPDPTFFDISRVKRPADRIARYLEYRFADDENMRKAASELPILGVDWAEFNGLVVPSDFAAKEATGGKLQVMLTKLATIERDIARIRSGSAASDMRSALLKTAGGTLLDFFTDTEVQELRKLRAGTLFREMAKRGCVMPLLTFYRYATGKAKDDAQQDPVYLKAASCLPGILQKLLSGGIPSGASELLGADSALQAHNDAGNTDQVQSLLDRADEAFGVSPSVSAPRIMRITIMRVGGPGCQKAAADLDAEQQKQTDTLVNLYGTYLAKAACDMQDLRKEGLSEKEMELIVLNNFSM
jgi:hypothetical protein